jgi:hypothetical protein
LINRKDFSSCTYGTSVRIAYLLMALFALGGGRVRVSAEEVRFERVGPYGGTVRSLLVSSKDSSLVYLGTNDGQLFESKDGGCLP